MTSPNDATEHPKPVVEPSPVSADLTRRALQQWIRQQEILAELGVVALQGKPFWELLNETVRLTAEGMNAEFCKVIEFVPADNRLLVRAGVGWHEGIVGRATIGADLESPSGFALRTGKPVISNHLENEQRFRTPELLFEHGIRRAMNVILQGDGSPYGVLEVDSRSEGEFSQNDIAFLQGAANILGMAIEQQQYQRKLQAALDRYQVLLREVNHRVKNSLQVVSSMLHLQANAVGDKNLSETLVGAANSIHATCCFVESRFGTWRRTANQSGRRNRRRGRRLWHTREGRRLLAGRHRQGCRSIEVKITRFDECPLSGVKPTSSRRCEMSASDTERT
jgi:hypothetical protein